MIQSAFLLGFLGSLHCIAMCGPIAIVVHTTNYKRGLLNSFIYSIGRVITYSILGALFFNIGFLSNLIGYQNILSIILGTLIILLLVLNLNQKGKTVNSFHFKLYNRIRQPFQAILKKPGVIPKLLLGLINGLLPCGLVYVALALSITQPNYVMAMFYMLLFGLGTIPAMILIAQFGHLLNGTKRTNLVKVIPVVSIVVATLLIVRGLALGIPYISPDIKIINNQPHSNCCHDRDRCLAP